MLIGENEAGQFVKMVHNGIEYAIMQMMAEAYEILSRGYGLSSAEIADVFEKFNEGKLKSFLFQISVPVLRKKDELSDGFLIDKILDKAGQKGTGRWTAMGAMEQGSWFSTVAEAVVARVISSQKSRREALAQYFDKPETSFDLPVKEMVKKLENALHAGMLITYAQGFDFMEQVAEEQKWNLNFSEISRIWQGGCIIRAEILRTLQTAFASSNKTDLLEIPEIQKHISESLADFREVVSVGTKNGIPMFCLASALSSFEAITHERTSANFIQGLRDYFGAHTYERVDREGVFHTEWEA